MEPIRTYQKIVGHRNIVAINSRSLGFDSSLVSVQSLLISSSATVLDKNMAEWIAGHKNELVKQPVLI